jgi:hypothetical protein
MIMVWTQWSGRRHGSPCRPALSPLHRVMPVVEIGIAASLLMLGWLVRHPQ